MRVVLLLVRRDGSALQRKSQSSLHLLVLLFLQMIFKQGRPRFSKNRPRTLSRTFFISE
jgi:hypothetical protein